MKNNNGRLIISFIIFVLCLLCISIIIYEVIYVDIFDIIPDDNSILTLSEISNRINSEDSQENINENIEIVEPIINNNMRK